MHGCRVLRCGSSHDGAPVCVGFVEQIVDSDLIEEPVLVTTSLDKVVRIWGLVGNFQGSLLHGPFSVRRLCCSMCCSGSAGIEATVSVSQAPLCLPCVRHVLVMC